MYNACWETLHFLLADRNSIQDSLIKIHYFRFYKRGNENLQNAKKESHVLPSSENFVVTSILKPYVDSSTKFLTYKRLYLLRYTQCSQPLNFNTEILILQHHLPVINHCLIHTTQNRALPNASNNR